MLRATKSHLNEAFAEVIELATNNSPHFFTRFEEMYPFFLPKMLKINPDFKVSEISFCAYLYLGFSTKEVADYTSKAVKTIENKRYIVRKKLKIPTNVNLEIWLKENIIAD